MVPLQCLMLMVMLLAFYYTFVSLFEIGNQMYSGIFKWDTVKDLIFSVCTFLLGTIITGMIQYNSTGLM